MAKIQTIRNLIGGMAALLFFLATAPAFAEQLFGEIGDLPLSSGEILKECRVGYRIYGKLDADKSNVILQPTWANGRTEQMDGGMAGLVAAGYYVIAVDALSNGVSSSPSNSRLQPRMQFPKITIRDMVESQHRLLTRVLGISHIRAVIGTSMGGMQAFQWVTTYPDFMDKAVALVGSPRLAPYDMLLWQTQIDAIKNDRRWNGGDYTENPATEFEYEIGALILGTPGYYNAHTTREQVFAEIARSRDAYTGPDANNKIRQAEAMMLLDVAEEVSKVKAKMFIAVSETDHTVTPVPALEFARKLGVVPFIYEGDCGHSVHNCQDGGMGAALMKFLAD